MYIHKKCRPEEYDLDYDKVQFGYCGECGLQGTIYHVKGSDETYTQKKFGVTTEHGENTTGEAIEAVKEVVAETIPIKDLIDSDEEPEEMGAELMEKAVEAISEEIAESIPDSRKVGYIKGDDGHLHVVVTEEITETIPETQLDKDIKEIAREAVAALTEEVQEEVAKSIPEDKPVLELDIEVPLTEEEQAQSDTAVEPSKPYVPLELTPEEEVEALKAKLAALEGKKE